MYTTCRLCLVIKNKLIMLSVIIMLTISVLRTLRERERERERVVMILLGEAQFEKTYNIALNILNIFYAV